MSEDPGRAPRCGLIVNPIAGMGGRVGLKGTDGPDVLAEARARGASPTAETRAARALTRLMRGAPGVEIRTGAGPLGEAVANGAGVPATILARPASAAHTKPEDTRKLAEAIEITDADLILIAGGDGTLRDVFAAIGDRLPILGIPAGVKMHSACFATSPEIAGDVAARFLTGSGRVRIGEAEVMDIDENAARHDRLSARLYGYCQAPIERALVQGPKSGGTLSDAEAIRSTAAELVEEMAPGTIYLLGPGTTTRAVADILGEPSTLLGCDAIRDRAVIGLDLDEAAILKLVAEHPAKLVVGIVGGQGCLFGRGNQQFSAQVIRRVGRDSIIVLAGAAKLAALSPARLFVDTGDPGLDHAFAGYMPVRTGRRQQAMLRIDGRPE